jgi:signal transduction histidine kinase
LNQDRLIIFERDLDDYGLMVDEVKISQLVHNLIKNADKHSESTEIKIKFKILDGKVVILIEDNGKGIDSYINKESLFIVDKDKKITKSGSGLGLPICKSIVNHHNGNIYFKDVERGTTIEFFLPL